MNITVNVSDVELNSVVGERLEYDADDERDVRVPQTLADLVAAKLVQSLALSPEYASLKRELFDQRRQIIRERVAAEVEAALSNPINLTNHYGESIAGQTTTLREEIAKMTAEALRVNHNNAMSGRQGWTPAQKVIHEEIERAFAAELAKVVADEKAKVVAAVRAKAADLIAQAVKEGVGR